MPTGRPPECRHRCGVDRPWEKRQLSLLAAGFSNREIPPRIFWAHRTVEKHLLQHVYRKLGVRDNVNAVRVAHAWDLVTEQSARSTP